MFYVCCYESFKHQIVNLLLCPMHNLENPSRHFLLKVLAWDVKSVILIVTIIFFPLSLFPPGVSSDAFILKIPSVTRQPDSCPTWLVAHLLRTLPAWLRPARLVTVTRHSLCGCARLIKDHGVKRNRMQTSMVTCPCVNASGTPLQIGPWLLGKRSSSRKHAEGLLLRSFVLPGGKTGKPKSCLLSEWDRHARSGCEERKDCTVQLMTPCVQRKKCFGLFITVFYFLLRNTYKDDRRPHCLN